MSEFYGNGTSALAELVSPLTTSESVSSYLQRTVEVAAATLGETTSASITRAITARRGQW